MTLSASHLRFVVASSNDIATHASDEVTPKVGPDPVQLNLTRMPEHITFCTTWFDDVHKLAFQELNMSHMPLE